jgi:hypothetical protein
MSGFLSGFSTTAVFLFEKVVGERERLFYVNLQLGCGFARFIRSFPQSVILFE